LRVRLVFPFAIGQSLTLLYAFPILYKDIMMNKINCIEMYHVRIPLDAPFYPSWIPGYPQTENRFDLIRIITEDGTEGFSAGPAISTERQGIGYLIAPYLIDSDAADLTLMQQRLREMSYLGIRSHWMEPAFWETNPVEGGGC